MFSLGIEPSITSTNGSSSCPSAACRKGLRNSSPLSVGESTLLCRLTFGSPGIAPSRTSSMLGWPAAVIETVSPSQLIPSEIQRMCTSSTPGGSLGSVDMGPSFHRRFSFLELERIHAELLAGSDMDLGTAAGRAQQGEAGQRALRPARLAPAGRRRLGHRELGALHRRALRRELER